MTTLFKRVNLFGGAATVDLPEDWIDASTLRDVPNYQEVYVEKSGGKDQSVIIEALQYEERVPDGNAAHFFFADLGHADGCVDSSLDENHVMTHSVEFLGARATKIIFEGIQKKSKSGRNDPVPVGVFMTAIRCKAFDCDVLVTCHQEVDEFGLAPMRAIHKRISDSIDFNDPTLFG